MSLFTTFMTFLAPAPRLPIDPAINLAERMPGLAPDHGTRPRLTLKKKLVNDYGFGL